MPRKYILDAQGEPVYERDLMKWAHWFQTADRRVALTKVGKVRISTVFLGLDHRLGQGEPILWETMVFGGHHDSEMTRCAGSREQALAMHAQMVARIRASRHGSRAARPRPRPGPG